MSLFYYFSRQRFFNESRSLVVLATPIVLSHVLQSAAVVLDTLMSGQYGTVDLSGVAIGSGLWFPFFVLFMGTLSALTPMVSQYHGSGNYDAIAPTVFQGLWVVSVFIIPAIAAYVYVDQLLMIMNVDPEISQIAAAYLRAILWGFPAIMAFNALRFYSDGLSFTRPAMIASFVGLCVNAPLNYILIFGKFGLPEMGGVGCGWASAISFWVMLVFMIIYIKVKPEYKRCHLYQRIYWPDFKVIKDLLKLGVPIGLSIVMEAGLFSVAALLLAVYGAVVVASHQIALNVASLAFMVPLSLSQALTIRVGYMIGQHNPEKARFTAFIGIFIGLSYALVSASILLLLNDWIPRLYTSEAEVIQLAASLLVFAAVFQLVDSLQATAAGALRGYKDTNLPMIMIFVSYWAVGFPVSWSLGLSDFWGESLKAQGYWIGLVSGLAMAGGLLTTRLILVSRRVLRA